MLICCCLQQHFSEEEGTIVNNEGRAQRYYRVIPETGHVKPAWQWFDELMKIKNQEKQAEWNHIDDVISSLAKEYPLFADLQNYIVAADYRMLNAKMPRQTIRYSGRTAMHANVEVSEAKLPQDNDSPLAYSMEGQPENPPSSFVPFYWTPGWNSVQAMYSYLDEPNGSLKGGDPGIMLLKPLPGKSKAFFPATQSSVKPGKGEFVIIPVYNIFGSEELSSEAKALSQRIHCTCSESQR